MTYSYDDVVTDALRDPNEIWRLLDSFWRARTTASTQDLVQYTTYGSLIAWLSTHVKAVYYRSSYDVQAVEPYLSVPWWPFVLFEDLIIEDNTVHYGDGYVYDDPPEIVYGEAGTDPKWIYPVADQVRGFGSFTDAVVDPVTSFDPSQVALNVTRSRLEFVANPFDSITAKTGADGRRYIVLWCRNLLLNKSVPFDQIGWVLGYKGEDTPEYVDSLRYLQHLVLTGPNTLDYRSGLNRTLGFPVATESGTVRDVQDDGANWVVSTDTISYHFPNDLDAAVVPGDELVISQPLTTAVQWWEYEQILDATPTELPGLILTIPLSTGVAAQLGFRNYDENWTYDASRPSPWRFTVSGDPDEVEQFWVDVDTYATANSVDLETLFGLPATVNPMMMVIDELLKNNVVMVGISLADIQVVNPAPFADRARALLSPGFLLVLQQSVGSVADVLDLGGASETVGYGYHAAVPTEVISVSGTDLTYSMLTPLVLTS